MQPILEFETAQLKVAPLGAEASVPNLLGMANMQNKSVFRLDEDDEIYEAYGKISNIYPYKNYNSYTRSCETRPVKTAVLQNEFLRAVFLPEFGGRLWQLTDLKSGRELLYTNDVIRPSNLALRDAWFSGGVEWNIGIIGHTPLTMEPLFTAQLKNSKGSPVLRMYEYERLRRLVYQMDFWLDEGDAFLNCRMRVVNQNTEMTPMYWWSNMAVPEYEDGRVVVPADNAFTSDGENVYKVDIPVVGGRDVTLYQSIPLQVDYFFNIPESSPRYIANLDAQGFGLLQYSTRRLRGRKLFSWGNNNASARWQEFLTEDAGRYVEIQAGLGKTQYGCIPMAPHAAWEWLERYGAVDLGGRADSFAEERERLTAKVSELAGEPLEAELQNSRSWAKQPGEVVYQGSGYAALEDACRAHRGEAPLCPHLNFKSGDTRQSPWYALLEKGVLPVPTANQLPADCMADDFWYHLLQTDEGAAGDWHAAYQLGLHAKHRGDMAKAEALFRESLALEETPWALYGLAAVQCLAGQREDACLNMEKGILLRKNDLSYVKEGFRLLLQAGGSETLLRVYRKLPVEIAAESRVLFSNIQALYRAGKYAEAYYALTANGGLLVDDLREGEDSLTDMWLMLREKLGMSKEPVPHAFNFSSAAPVCGF